MIHYKKKTINRQADRSGCIQNMKKYSYLSLSGTFRRSKILLKIRTRTKYVHSQSYKDTKKRAKSRTQPD